MTGLRWTPEVYAAHLRRERLAPRANSVHLVLPWPPTVNHSTRPTARGGKILTEGHRQFRAAVAQIVATTGQPFMDGRLHVQVILVAPNRRKFDLDNRCKAMLDALQLAGVFHDDEQVDRLTIQRAPAEEVPDGRGAAIVTITRAPQ